MAKKRSPKTPALSGKRPKTRISNAVRLLEGMEVYAQEIRNYGKHLVSITENASIELESAVAEWEEEIQTKANKEIPKTADPINKKTDRIQNSGQIIRSYGEGVSKVDIEIGRPIPPEDKQRFPYIPWKYILPDLKKGESFIMKRESWRTSIMRASEATGVDVVMRLDTDGYSRCWIV